MGPSGVKPSLLCRDAARMWALASALLALSGSVAGAAGPMLPQAQPALHVQYRQEPYQQYRPDQYQQDQYQQDQYRRERYGPGQRGYDDRQDRYGQQGGGRGGSYQRSCGDIQQEGSILSAVCGDGRGGRVESSLDVNRCGRSDISNNGGYLQCRNIRARGRRVG